MNKYVGQSIPLLDGLEKACGEMKYLDDMRFTGALEGKILRSTIAHGRITLLDVSGAWEVEGVRAVATYENTSSVEFNGLVREIDSDWPATERIFNDRILQYGQPVAAVAADSLEAAQKALKQIRVEYEEYKPVLHPEEAYKNEIKLFPEGNHLPETHNEIGDVDQALEQADQVFEHWLDTPMVHHFAMEPHVCVADWDDQDRLTVWTPHQGVYGAQIVLAKIFSKPYADIRVIRTAIGGAFGIKVGMHLEPVCAELSRMAGKPVKIRMTRQETMIATWTRHSARLYVKAAVQDGRITGMDIRQYLNSGPHCGGTHYIPAAQTGKLYKLYKFPSLRFHSSPVATNTPLQGAMRGFGSPQLFTPMEMLLDKIAYSQGLDRVALREQYLFLPHEPNPKAEIDLIGNCRSRDCLLRGKEAFGWDESLPEEEGYLFGKGVAVALHGNGVAPFAPDLTGMTLNLYEDGSLCLSTGICDHGGGSYTVIPQIIGEILDVDPRRIRVKTPDTENTPYDLGAYASRNTWVGGNCAIRVAQKMKKMLVDYAADYFSTSSNEIVCGDGWFSHGTDGQTVSLVDLVRYVFNVHKQKLIVSEYFSSQKNAGSYGAHFALVRISKATGEVKILNYVAACDVGKAINPKLVEGQIEGGIQMGVGYALSEELLLDPETGRPLNANLKKYKIPKASDMPDKLQVLLVEEGEDYGPYGAKSIGEAATVPVAAAIVSAVNDALGGWADFHKIPLNPDMILEKIQRTDNA